MTRIVLVLAFVASFVAFNWTDFASAIPNRERPRCYERFPDGLIHDFGKVPTGTQCKRVFRIVNTSDASMRITSVRSSGCGGAGAIALRGSMDRFTLRPRDEGKLEITVDTRRFIGAKYGTLYLVVETNKGTEEFRFIIQADSVYNPKVKEPGK